MQNPFIRAQFREKFSAQLGIQFAAIQGIESFLRGVGMCRYNRVEIVVLSHWLTLMGLGFSKVMDDRKQATECVAELNASMPRLFEGLCHGVRDANGQMAIPIGFFPGHYQDYLPLYFAIEQVRSDRYSKLFAKTEPTRNERVDALGRVIDEASRNIVEPSEMSKWFDFELFNAVRAAAVDTINSVTRLLA